MEVLTKKKLLELIKDMPDDAVITGSNYAGFIRKHYADDVECCNEEFFNDDTGETYKSVINISANW